MKSDDQLNTKVPRLSEPLLKMMKIVKLTGDIAVLLTFVFFAPGFLGVTSKSYYAITGFLCLTAWALFCLLGGLNMILTSIQDFKRKSSLYAPGSKALLNPYNVKDVKFSGGFEGGMALSFNILKLAFGIIIIAGSSYLIWAMVKTKFWL